jgi:glycosyltransferase involved in cell wall biosynthesis
LQDGKIRSIFVENIVNFLYPSADHVIAVSHGVKDDLVRNFSVSSNDIDVIHNPFRLQNIKESLSEKPTHTWLSDDELDVILSAGTLEEQKDFSTLIQAFTRISNEKRRLIIVGDGPLEKKLRQENEQAGIESRVEIIDYVDNIYSFMGAADVFVSSSAWEGFGNVIVEALTVGCPIVATDCSGPRDIIDPSVGRIVPIGSDVEMATAIEAILKNPPNEEDLEKKSIEFDSKIISKKYQNILF